MTEDTNGLNRDDGTYMIDHQGGIVDPFAVALGDPEAVSEANARVVEGMRRLTHPDDYANPMRDETDQEAGA